MYIKRIALNGFIFIVNFTIKLAMKPRDLIVITKVLDYIEDNKIQLGCPTQDLNINIYVMNSFSWYVSACEKQLGWQGKCMPSNVLGIIYCYLTALVPIPISSQVHSDLKREDSTMLELQILRDFQNQISQQENHHLQWNLLPFKHLIRWYVSFVHHSSMMFLYTLAIHY